MAKLAKDSGIPWIGSIPFDWQTVKMKQVADFQPRCDVSGLSADSEITYTPMECIRNGYFVNNTALYGDLPPSLTPYNNGDIVFAKVTPCFENGNIAIMENLNSGFGLGSSELFVVRPRAIGTRFLFYWLQNDAFIQKGRATMTGTGGLKRVSPYFVKNCPLPLPSDKEQQRIANFLDAECARIDAIIEQTRATVEEYKKLKQSIITQAVTKGIRLNRPMKDSGIEWIGKIPEDWGIVKTHRIIISTQNGLTRRDLEKSEGTIVLKLKNITADNNLDYSDVNRINLAEDESKKYVLKNGDLLFVRVNGSKELVGKCAIFTALDEPVAYNDHIIRVRLNCYIEREYYLFFLLSNVGRTEIDLRTCTAAGQFTISGEGLRDMMVILPPLEEQREIVAFLRESIFKIDCLVKNKRAFINDLEAYKKSLIYEYVTGKKEAPL